jgi:hypothetical protein
MIKTFKQFVIENLSNDDSAELRSMGFSSIDLDQLAKGFGGTVDDNVLKLESSWNMNIEDFGIDSDLYPDIERDFWAEITILIDFDNSTIKAQGFISQKELNLWETFDLDDMDWGEFFQNGDPSSMQTDEIAEDIELAMDAITGYEDSVGFFEKAREIVSNALASKYDRWDDDDDDDDDTVDDDDNVSEKKKLKFHHSDAPDAKGKFKELGVQKLADWLIRTRGGNMQKITGSLNQQINFNKRKNPSYAKKMESTREAVKRKLAKRKDK